MTTTSPRYFLIIALFFFLITNAKLFGQGLSGIIATESGTPIENVTVACTDTPSYMTIADGFYIFNDLMDGLDYEVSPLKNDDLTQDLSALDMLILQDHIDGISLLSSPYQKIAADVNNDGCIDEADLIELREVILGESTEFSNNTSWRFVPEDSMIQQNDPCPYPAFPETILIEDYLGEAMNQDFVGVKIGDLSAPVSNGGLPSPEFFLTDFFSTSCGQIIEIDVFTEDFINIKGFQNSINWDPGVLKFISVTNFGLSEFSTDNVGLQDTTEAMISFVWIDPTDGLLPPPDSIFRLCTINFQVVGEDLSVSDVLFTDTPTPRQIVCLENNELFVVEGDYLNAEVQNVAGNFEGSITPYTQCNSLLYDFDLMVSGPEPPFYVDVHTINANYSITLGVGETHTITNIPGEPGENIINVSVIDVNGCSGSSITQSVFLSFMEEETLIEKDTSCFETTSIALTIGGGAEPYTYEWVDQIGNPYPDTLQISELESGLYYCIVTDDVNCELTVGPILIDNAFVPLEIAAAIVSNDTSCYMPGRIDLSITGGVPPYSFEWSNGSLEEDLTGLASGAYSCTISDTKDCEIFIGPIQVDNAFLPIELTDVLIESDTNNLMLGSLDITMSGGSGAYSFEWSNGSQEEDPGALEMGAYTCLVIDSLLGCEIVIGPFTIDNVMVNTQEAKVFKNLDLYPNPTSGILFIDLSFDAFRTVDIQLLSTLGKVVYETDATGIKIEQTLDLSAYPNGVYFIRFHTDEVDLVTKVILY